MSTMEHRDEQKWEEGYEGHTVEQQRRLARLPLWEKIDWLETAQRVAQHLGRRRKTGNTELPPDPTG